MDDRLLDSPVRLSRNRDYNILWTGMLLSELAGEVVFIAFPLLVLAHSGTAVQVALVTSVLAATRMAVNLPAGVIADRWDRRGVLLAAQAARSLAMGSVVLALLLGDVGFTHILVAAAVEGAASSVFQPAEHAALPQVVPAAQLSDALARNAARPFAALLLGPALAGFTFGLHELVPFAVDTGMLVASFLALTALRLPRRPRAATAAGEPGGTDHRGPAEGFAWLWRQPALRTTLAWVVLVNLGFHALVVIILVVSGEGGAGHGEIGLMMTCFGAGGLLGAAVVGGLHSALRGPVIIIGSSWVFAAVAALMSVVPAGLPLGLLLGLAAVFFPAATTTILTYQLTVVPDAVRGRLSGLVGLGSDLAGTVGPMVGGVLVAVTGSGSTSILVCAALLAAAALGASLSPTLRRLPAPPAAGGVGRVAEDGV